MQQQHDSVSHGMQISEFDSGMIDFSKMFDPKWQANTKQYLQSRNHDSDFIFHIILSSTCSYPFSG